MGKKLKSLKLPSDRRDNKWQSIHREATEFEWECLRRNENYLNEYKNLIQTNDFQQLVNPLFPSTPRIAYGEEGQ